MIMHHEIINNNNKKKKYENYSAWEKWYPHKNIWAIEQEGMIWTEKLMEFLWREWKILTSSIGLTHGIKGMFVLFTRWRGNSIGWGTISCDALHLARALVLQGALLLTETAAGRKGESLRRSQAISLRIIIHAMLGSNSMKARIKQLTRAKKKTRI